MIKDLISAATMTLIACAALQPKLPRPRTRARQTDSCIRPTSTNWRLGSRIPRARNGKSRRRSSPASDHSSGKTVADIGAGTGYFSFPISKQAAKVIAIDIDQRFLDYIAQKKQTQKIGGNIETRLTKPDSSGLKPGEADMVLIVDTYHHIEGEDRLP